MKELYNQLDIYWQKVVDDLIQSLKDVDRYKSGNTAQSIGELNDDFITKSGDSYRIIIEMPDYYEYMDEGVSGAKKNTNRSRFRYKDKGKGKNGRGQKGIPPISAIRLFMRNNRIEPKNISNIKNKRGTRAEKKQNAEEARNGLAFAIAYNIWKNGIEKTNFYSNVVNDKLIEDFQTKLLSMYGNYVVTIVTQNKNV